MTAGDPVAERVLSRRAVSRLPVVSGDESDADQPRPRNRSQRQIDESMQIRDRVVSAAMEVFASKGYRETTLAEVAERVGLKRPGLLHHFGSKDALFRAVLERERDWADRRIEGPESLTHLRDFVGGDERARVPLQFLHVLEGETVAGNEVAAPWVRERFARVRADIERRLAAARAAGTVDDAPDIEVQSLLIAAAISGLQKQWLLDESVDSRAAVDLLLAVLGPTPAVAKAAPSRPRRPPATPRTASS